MRTEAIGIALALFLAPHMAAASPEPINGGARASKPAGSVTQTRYNLTPGPVADQIAASQPGQHKFAPVSRGTREAEGTRFGDGEVQYIEGPSWDYRTSRRGPMFEVGALGGGMENAPYLAHVAMDWRF
jgi:hypothetical protein